jgi:hypothetical protein
MTTITITVSQSLSVLKEQYRKHFGLPKKEKVTKKDISIWLGSLVESDVDSVF